ncbi:MAG: AAA family ATPase [Trueperaceae bacterium]|nr:AAA family ATPase [Trueperaceae bacterium]
MSAAVGIIWERLELEGFGRHERLEVRFSGGLETWVGANETGKSTAVMGLLATLWGMPHLQDPSALGWARYRAWSGGPHRGTLTFRVADDERFTVTRDFERHQVRVTAHRTTGEEVVVDAVHNPNARRETSPYEPWLERTLGLTDLSLVLETFVVAQGHGGARAHRLRDEVQALVSGAGGGSYRAALDRLADALRARTRTLRPLDVGLADGRNDRALEDLERDIIGHRRALEAGREAADGTRAAQEALGRAETAYARAKEASERLRATVQAQGSWVDRREASRHAVRRLAETKGALAGATVIERSLHETEENLDATWPAFADAPAEAEGQLETFTETRRRLAEVIEREQEAEADLAARREAAHDALAELELAAADAPTLDEAESDADSDGEADEFPEFDFPDDAQPAVRSWEAIGDPAGGAIRRMRRGATALVRQVQTVLDARERLREAHSEFEPIDIFEGLDTATRELLDEYAPRGRALAEALVRARRRRDELLERMRRHEAAFAEVRSLDAQQVEALRAFDASWEDRRDPRPWRFAAALAGGVVGWFGVPFALALLDAPVPPWSGWTGAAVMSLVSALVVPRGDGTAPARRALVESGIEGDDESLRQRLRQREAFEAQRDQVDDDAHGFETADVEAAAIEADGVAFRDAVGPLIDSLPPGVDPGQAFARWKVLAPKVAREREALAAQVGYLAEITVDEIDGAPAARAGDTAAELARLAAFHGVVDATLDGAAEQVGIVDLASWLDRVSDATWDLWQAAADEHDALRAVQREAQRHLEAARTLWGERVSVGVAALERVRVERGVAEREEAATTAALAWLWPRLATGGDEHDASLDRDDGLIGDDEISDAALGAFDDVGRIEAAAPWNPQMLRQGWAERRRAHADVEAQRAALRAHLDAAGAPAIGDLRRSLEHAEVAAGAALTAWHDLVRAHPDLPAADLDAPADGSDAKERFRRAEAATVVATAGERDAHERLLEAQRDLARRHGATDVNLAATGVALEAAERAALAMREEISCLALAHRELGAAVEEFRLEHRQRLEERSTEYLLRFSGVEGRRVELGEGFAAAVRERSGDLAVPAQLSQGARDQLALALRLAVADLVSDDVALPLIFDDPFLHWDAERLERAREALEALALDRHVIVLSHRPAIESWGRPVERSG